MFRFAIFALIFLLSAMAHGQGADETDRARTLGREGVELYDQGRFQEAYEKLREADQIHHAPTLVLYMARSQRNRGKLLSARELYQSLVNEKLPADASAPFRNAKDTAYRELEVVRQQIPSVLISVSGMQGATVQIDGKAIDSAQLASPVELDPGQHLIEARAADGSSATKTATLQKGGGITKVKLASGSGGGTSGDDGEAPPGSEPDVGPSSSNGLLAPALAALGVGAAGLAVGIATGVMAQSMADEVNSRCEDIHCFESDESLADEANTLAHVSTAGFVIAGVGVVVGVVLLVVPTGDEGEAVALDVTPTGFALRGNF